MKIFLSGQKSFGAAALDLIMRMGHEVTGVAAPCDKPDALAASAELNHIHLLPSPLLTADRLPEGTELIVAAHSHAFIGRKTRYRARLGAIGYHPSLLPLHRGRDAVRWTIKMRDRVAGGTVFWLGDRVDAGAIAAQDFCFVRPEDTASSLWRRELFPMGLQLLALTLHDIARNRIVRIPQDEALATWEPALDAPRLARPDLLQLGDGSERFRNFRVVVERGIYHEDNLASLTAPCGLKTATDPNTHPTEAI